MFKVDGYVRVRVNVHAIVVFGCHDRVKKGGNGID